MTPSPQTCLPLLWFCSAPTGRRSLVATYKEETRMEKKESGLCRSITLDRNRFAVDPFRRGRVGCLLVSLTFLFYPHRS
ncbi:hypothetical protein CPB86DRAFT_227454 [Serendipita vermifera]|nr:hypothetical protein CPB86DRAFT_227454 [Serendipita vermifera]